MANVISRKVFDIKMYAYNFDHNQSERERCRKALIQPFINLHSVTYCSAKIAVIREDLVASFSPSMASTNGPICYVYECESVCYYRNKGTLKHDWSSGFQGSQSECVMHTRYPLGGVLFDLSQSEGLRLSPKGVQAGRHARVSLPNI